MGRRIPTRLMTGNLRWTRAGTVWADWILTGIPYGLRPVKDKQTVRALHTGLFRALPGESLLLGIRSGLDPAAIVAKMLDGVDLDQCPEWVAECEATLDSLDQIGPGQRVFWLSVPLGTTRTVDGLTDPLKTGLSDLRDALGLPRPPLAARELERRLAQAARIAEGIPGPFNPAPATRAQMIWLHDHGLRRGLFQDQDVPGPDDTPDLLTTQTGGALNEPILDEGGQSDLGSRSFARLNPAARRYLKVTDAATLDDPEPSYQTLAVISEVPDGGTVFPGSEVIGRIDESGVDVDWAIRLTVRASAAVATQNQRALRNLNEQYGQRSGEISHGLNMLDRVARDLAEYVATLESDKLEVETQATMIFAVGATTPESSRAQARALGDFLSDTGYKLASPLGYQEELWWGMQPGVAASRAIREFAQVTTSRALAATVPLASSRLGDNRGSALGLNIANGPLLAENVPCGPADVVLHDLEGASDRLISGSAAVAGELGAGKALALDTPIPTPSGWSQIGDLAPGDLVFDEAGRPVAVLAVSPIMENHTCYEVTFSDGSAIVADEEHYWTTLPMRIRNETWNPDHATLQIGGPDLTGPGWPQHGITVTTRDLKHTRLARSATCHWFANHAIPVTGALQLPDVELPIEPAVLGRQLRTRQGVDNPSSPDDPVVEIGSCDGQPISTSYLRAGIGQRQALLAGLVDSADRSPDGVVEFTTTNDQLARDVQELACSLGHVAALQRAAVHDGRPDDGQVWTVTLPTSDGQARLPDPPAGEIYRHRYAGHRIRYVVTVREVPSVPVRCIKVESPSSLYLASRAMIPTHNTATLMTLASDVTDRLGQLVIADRTPKGEWAAWAKAVTSAVVVDSGEPELSLDPLRVFGPRVGSRMMQTFLTPLLNIRPTDDQGVLLADVLDPDYLANHGLGSSGALLTHLQADCHLPGAPDLSRLINVFARRDFGRVIFDQSVPPLTLAARAIVIRTHNLPMPSREELENEHLFKQLGLEKLFGRAFNALIATVAREVCFADTSVLSGFVVSEAHGMTISFEGEREIVELIRDGRKHRAIVLLDSHDPEADFGSPTLRGLIPTRILMRHRDKTLAQRGLAWLDLDPDDDDLVDMVRHDTSPIVNGEVPPHRRGEGTMRDMSGSIGRIKVMLPARPHRAAAITAGGTAAGRRTT